MSPAEDLHELGRRIRQSRTERRMTLKDVESISGLSATHLSEIERGRTSPTLGALVRIARSLEKEPAFFLEDEALEDIAHVRSEETRTLSLGPGVTATVLTPGIPGSGISAYRVTFEPEAEAELEIPAQAIAGDLLYMVVRGSVQATIGDDRLEASQDDSIHATLLLDHHVKPSSPEPTELILISTRPLGDILGPLTEDQ